MRNSQRVVIGAIGVLAAAIVAMTVWARFAVSRLPDLSGERTTRTYDYTGFRSIAIDGQWRATIERRDAFGVAVEAPAELVDDLQVRLDGDVLRLDYDGPWRFAEAGDRSAFEATIALPALESLEISGTAVARLSGFDGGSLSLEVSGTGDLRGTASRFDALTLDASGAVSVDLGDVPVTNAELDMSGAGNVTLRMAGGRLTGDLSGSVNLEYYGTVSEESLDRSGFVSVRRRD